MIPKPLSENIDLKVQSQKMTMELVFALRRIRNKSAASKWHIFYQLKTYLIVHYIFVSCNMVGEATGRNIRLRTNEDVARDTGISNKAGVHDAQLWKGYIWNTLSATFQCQSCDKANLLHFLYLTYVSSNSLKRLCFMPTDIQNVADLNQPCATLIYTYVGQKYIAITIKVPKQFTVNFTLHDSYIHYSDNCLMNYLLLNDGPAKGSYERTYAFCGHVLLEYMYMKYNNIQLALYSNVHSSTKLNAKYEVLTKGLVHRFNGTESTHVTPAYHEISLPSLPHSVYLIFGGWEYIWYYALHPQVKEFTLQQQVQNLLCFLQGFTVLLHVYISVYQT